MNAVPRGDHGESVFHFLYRTDRGRIDRATWWRGIVPLVAIGAVMTGAWLLVRPYTHHDLATSPFLAAPTILAFLYLAIFSFAVILIAVCSYNLSAKRFRDRGRHGSLAAVLPLAAFCAGALIWFIPRSFGEVPGWASPLSLLVVAAIAAWNVWDLGFGPTLGERP